MLETREIVKSYKKKRVLDNVSVVLKQGEIVGILGPNGAGKSTLFKIITGLLTPDSGDVLLDGEKTSGLHLHQLIRRGLGYLPQEPSLFYGLTVLENLEVVCSASLNSFSYDKIQNVVSTLGLDNIKDRITEYLSGGEKRKLEVARSLLLNPKYILLDEPFSQIDPKTVYELIGIIKKMKESNIGVFITDHSAREVFSVCDRIYIISEGKIIVTGTPEELKKNTLVRDIYLGQLFDS